MEQAWTEEISRRIKQVESGEEKSIPWEDLYLRLASRLNIPNAL